MDLAENKKEEPLASKVAENIGSTTDRAGELASNAKAKVNQFTSQLGSSFKQLGYRVRAKSPHETIHEVTDKVADRLESAGDYLESKDVKWIVSDVGTLIRRFPKSSLAIMLGIGFWLARRK